MITRTCFDAILQTDCEFNLYVDQNGEIVCQSTQSDYFLKIPVGLDLQGAADYLDACKAASEGQVSNEELNQTIEQQQELADQLGE